CPARSKTAAGGRLKIQTPAPGVSIPQDRRPRAFFVVALMRTNTGDTGTRLCAPAAALLWPPCASSRIPDRRPDIRGLLLAGLRRFSLLPRDHTSDLSLD